LLKVEEPDGIFPVYRSVGHSAEFAIGTAFSSRYQGSLAQIPDAKLAFLVSDKCQSIGLATLLMYEYLKVTRDSGACDDAIGVTCEVTRAAMSYAGRSRHTHAVIDYGPAVAAMVSMVPHDVE
jgi:hypothetical protein